MIRISKKYLPLAIMSALLVLLIGIIAFIWLNPNLTFKRKFGFELPKSAKVVNYSHLIEEDTFLAKVAFDKNNLEYLENQLLGVNKNYRLFKMDEHDIIPAFDCDSPWWDMDRNEAIFAYHAFMSGILAKTKEVYTFITFDSDGQYYLYVVH